MYGTPPDAAPPGPDTGRSNWFGWAAVGTVVAVIVALLAFIGHGIVDGGSTPSSRGLASGSTTSTTDPSTSTSGPRSSTTAPGRGTTPSTTPGAAAPKGGTFYRDPNGIYTMSVAPGWTRSPTSLTGIPMWMHATGAGGSASMNVTSEELPYQYSLLQIVDATVQQLQHLSEVQVHSTTGMTLNDGTPAILVRYTNLMVQGTHLEGELLVTSNAFHAVAVTVAAPSADANPTFDQVRPYLLTLHLL
jgi:hypothetical protein